MAYKIFGVFGFLIIALPIVTTQNNELESRSLSTCLSYMGSLIMEQGMSIPTDESIFPILADPDVRKYLLNHCIFYHNKTGIWQDPSDDVDSINDTIITEFEAKYPAPDVLKDFFLGKK